MGRSSCSHCYVGDGRKRDSSSRWPAMGWIVEHMLVAPPTEAGINRQVGALMVFFAYLPAVAIVLRRSNEGAMAPWQQSAERLIARAFAGIRRSSGDRRLGRR